MATNDDHGHRIAYISHGAGPLPVLGDDGHVEMVENLQHLASRIPRPKAIVLISAHWEASEPTTSSGEHPPLLYDYYGFPQESYELEYPAPGHVTLEQDIRKVLGNAGFACRGDEERGFDHGMFIPLMIMYPEADIPCVQLSMLKGLDPGQHLALGKALSGLEHDGLLILGSGFSFHNMRAFFAPETPQAMEQNLAFEHWLLETCSSTELEEEERVARLVSWESAPSARYCHPREEHLLPLHVCCGAAGSACTECFQLKIFGKWASIYLW